MDSDFDNGKQELHLLVDQLPTEQVAAALQYMRYLRIDPVVFPDQLIGASLKRLVKRNGLPGIIDISAIT